MTPDHTLSRFRIWGINAALRFIHWAIRCDGSCVAHTFLVKPYFGKNLYGLLTLALSKGDYDLWQASIESVKTHNAFIDEQERLDAPSERRGNFEVLPGGRK